MFITDIFPPWWDFVMVGICRQAIIIINHHHRPGQGLLTTPASPSDPLHQDLWLRLARKKYYSMNIISNHHKGMRRHLNVDDEIEGKTWVPSACEHLEPPEKLRK